VGATGSGKTTALKYLDNCYTKLFPAMRHYVLDSKFDGDFDSWPGRVQSDKAPGRPGSNQRYQVWQPVNLIPEEIEKWLWHVRHDAPAVLEIDELVHLVYKNGQYSEEFNIIQKIGRSLPIGRIVLTQELTRIPSNAFKQSSHRMVFYIDKSAEYDKRLSNALLKSKVDDPIDHYGLYYQHRDRRGEPLYYPTIQKFLGVR
jgi:hypothetical protein